MTPLEVLAAHHVIPHGDRCMCGHRVGWGGTAESRERHAAHVLDALTNAGHVVVALPEADDTTPSGMGKWYFDDGRHVQGIRHTERHPIAVMGGQFHNVDTARALAAALLAAAAAAETGGKA